MSLAQPPNVIARQVDIRNVGGDYYDYSTRISHERSRAGRSTLEFLIENISSGAIHDSAHRCDAPKCHPETRVAVQGDIMSWITHGQSGHDPRRIMWITGPAGSGKTAIMGSITQKCQELGWLAASYFFSSFSGTPDRMSKLPFIATLVYQLLLHEELWGLKEEILSAIERDPAIFKKQLGRQFEVLILQPLKKLASQSISKSLRLKVIAVDGLDECEADVDALVDEGDRQGVKEQSHKEILSLLTSASNSPSFPFRIIVASRPEPVIKDFFTTATPPIALELCVDNKYDPDSDIALYLKAKFSDIQRRSKLPATWPSQADIDLLVSNASGQFVYAATVIRFVEDRNSAPHEQLGKVLTWRVSHEGPNPFAALDALYMGILQTSPEPQLAAKWLVILKNDFPIVSTFVRALLESYPGETEHHLGRLRSLVSLTESDDGLLKVDFHHRSLLDFLADANRSAHLHVSAGTQRQVLIDRYYRVLKNRGPEVAMQNSTYTSADFNHRACRYLAPLIDTRREYSRGDVTWWINQLPHDSRTDKLPHMFYAIHEQCTWYRCCPACKIWRKGILRYCKANSWHLPSWLEIAHDRFRKYEFGRGRYFPLYLLQSPPQLPAQKPK